MKASVFVGTSLDGFIARADGPFDFLPAEVEPHGYEEFIATVDALVIGRKAYETALGFDEWAYGKEAGIRAQQSFDCDSSPWGSSGADVRSPSPHRVAARGARHPAYLCEYAVAA